MNGLSKKVLTTFLAGTLLILSSNSVSANASSDTIPEKDSIPAGFVVVKQYNADQDSAKTESPIQLTTDKSEKTNSLSKNSSDETVTQSTYDTKIINNDAHLYRELKNEKTGEIVNQYVANVTAVDPNAKDLGSSKKDDKSDITVTVRLFYHSKDKGDGNTYLGLDKIYYRYEGTPDRSQVVTIQGKVQQWGPGIDGYAKTQELDLSTQYGYKLGTTKLIDLKAKNWTEVLQGGLATSVGIKLETGISNAGIIHQFSPSFFFKGVGPLG